MAATIKIKNSSTTGAVPTSSDLVQGELAVNVTDLGLYTENASGTVVKLNAPSIDDKGTGATKRLTIDTSGNLGLGVTPSTIDLGKMIEVGQVGCNLWTPAVRNIVLNSNAYYNGGNKYATTGAAGSYQIANGVHYWYNAGSGTAGNAITFTQAMTLDASGNLLVGTTSSTFSQSGASKGINLVGSTNSAEIDITRSGGSNTGFLFIGANDIFQIGTSAAYALTLNTNNTERARIDSSGNLLVGTTSQIGSGKFNVLFSGATLNAVETQDSGTNSGAGFFSCRNSSGVQIGSITRVGTTNAVVFNTTSDYRLKTVIGPVSGYKERIAALEPIEYEWKEDGTGTRGFLAHKFQESYAHSVTGQKDAVDKDGKPIYQAMQAGTSEVIADLVAYIQNLETRLAALEQA